MDPTLLSNSLCKDSLVWHSIYGVLGNLVSILLLKKNKCLKQIVSFERASNQTTFFPIINVIFPHHQCHKECMLLIKEIGGRHYTYCSWPLINSLAPNIEDWQTFLSFNDITQFWAILFTSIHSENLSFQFLYKNLNNSSWKKILSIHHF